MANFLVTGGAGFIGSHLVELLLREGHGVRVLDNFSSGKEGNLQAVSSQVQLQRGDIRKREDLKEALQDIEGVFHLAAISSVQLSLKEPLHVHEVNCTGTLNLLEISREMGVKRIVFISSAAVYGNSLSLPLKEDLPLRPISTYGASKVSGEAYLLSSCAEGNPEGVILRLFNIYGPRQDPHSPYSGVVSQFLQALLSGKRPILYGDGQQTRDFLYVEDACRAMLTAMVKEGVSGEAFNIAGGKETTIEELGEKIFALQGKSFDPLRLPQRPQDIRRSVAFREKAEKMLNWRPSVSLEEGLQRTWEWIK